MDRLDDAPRRAAAPPRREVLIARYDRVCDLPTGGDYLEVPLTPELAQRAMFGGQEVEPGALARQAALHRAFVRVG